MKANLIKIQIIFVLVLGLISCKEDNNPESEPTPPPATTLDQPQVTNPVESIHAVHTDRSYHDLKSIKQLNSSSSIQLKLKGIQPTDTSIEVATSCTTNDLQGRFDKQILRNSTNKIPIKDLLPIEIYTPTLKESLQVLCDIDLKVLSAEKIIATAALKQVSIVGVQEFEVHKPAFRPKFPRHILFLSHLHMLPWSLPMENGNIRTLCRHAYKDTYISTNKIKVAELFNEEIFYHDNIQHCRFIGTDESNALSILSPPFLVQKTNPQLEVRTFNLIPGAYNADLSRGPLARIELINHQDVPAHIIIDPKNLGLTMRPLFIAPKQPVPQIYVNDYKVPTRWLVDRPHISSEKNKKIYRIGPNESLTLELVTNSRIQCQHYKNEDFTRSSQMGTCVIHYNFSGYLYKIASLPAIRINNYSDLKYRSWVNLPLGNFMNTKSPAGFNGWRPNQKVKQFCHLNNVFNHVHDYMRKVLAHADHKCRLEN